MQDTPERGIQDAKANQLDPDFAFVCLLSVEMRGRLSALGADCFDLGDGTFLMTPVVFLGTTCGKKWAHFRDHIPDPKGPKTDPF